MDYDLRDLERAAAGGDVDAMLGLIRMYVRSGRFGDVLPLCKDVLSVCSFGDENYFFVRSVLVSHGVFVLFHTRGVSEDKRDVFSLFGVPCNVPNFVKGRFKNWTNLRLDFCWDKKRFGSGRFTQKDIAKNLNGLEKAKKRDFRVLPSAMYYHWCVRFVYSLPEGGDRDTALKLFKDDFRKWVLTSTRVFYGKQKIEHLYKMPDSPAKMTVGFELMGIPIEAYLRDSRLQVNDAGLNISRAVLGADESIVDLDQLYVHLGAPNGVHIWRLNQRGERAVGLGFGIYGFYVNAYVYVIRPLRLVSSRDFSTGNQG